MIDQEELPDETRERFWKPIADRPRCEHEVEHGKRKGLPCNRLIAFHNPPDDGCRFHRSRGAAERVARKKDIQQHRPRRHAH